MSDSSDDEKRWTSEWVIVKRSQATLEKEVVKIRELGDELKREIDKRRSKRKAKDQRTTKNETDCNTSEGPSMIKKNKTGTEEEGGPDRELEEKEDETKKMTEAERGELCKSSNS